MITTQKSLIVCTILITVLATAGGVLAPPIDFFGTVTIGANTTTDGAVVRVYINDSETAVTQTTVGSSLTGYYLVHVEGTDGDNVSFRVDNISVNEAAQTYDSSVFSTELNLTVTLQANDAAGCESGSVCVSGLCVHNICRSSNPYCGDDFCDSGESCSADNDACSGSQVCSNGCTISGGGGGGPPITPPGQDKDVSQRPELVPGVGIRGNQKLQEAIEKVLGRGRMSDQAIENLERLSESIVADLDTTRRFRSSGGSSSITTTMKYTGSKKAKNFAVYDSVPKSFAQSAADITVQAPGAIVEVVQDDPEFLIIFPEVLPNQELTITYEVSEVVDETVLEQMTTRVFAEEIEDISPEPPPTSPGQDPFTTPDGGEEPPSIFDNTPVAIVFTLFLVIIIILIVGVVWYYNREPLV